MGLFTSCCKPSVPDVPTPDVETRRRQQVEAAERRLAGQQSRGVKDAEKVLKLQQKAEEMEKREKELAKEGGAVLKWTAN